MWSEAQLLPISTRPLVEMNRLDCYKRWYINIYRKRRSLSMQDQEQEVKTYAQMLREGLDEVFSSEPYRRFLRFIITTQPILTGMCC